MDFRTSRDIPVPPSRVFAEFADSARLAVWWGPAGFSSTFTAFDFSAGGTWKFTLHGPDGRDYANDIVVKEVDRPHRIVLRHTSGPHYSLGVTLESAAGGGTTVGWNQEFDNPEFGRRNESFLRQANEEPLDRLTESVLRE